MPRRILFYTAAFDGGGAEIVFRRLADGFAEIGAEVIVCADATGGAHPRDGARLRYRLLGGNHLVSTLRLAALLRTCKPDASFSALGAQNLKHVIAAALAGRLRGCVLGIHGFAEAEPKRLSRLSYRLLPVTTRLAARTICVSDVLLADVAVRWRGARTRVCRIYNPLPRRSSDAGSTAGRRENPPLILALGRLEPIKGFDDLIAALARMADGNARLAILGNGPGRETLLAAASRFSVGNRVELPGFVADPTPWFERAAVVAVASRSESFGLTVAEALSHGLPVVTTDCGGPPEIVGALEGCHVVPVGDVDALAAALDEALIRPGDPRARRERSEAFAFERIRDAYAALIDGLARGRPAARAR